MIISRGAGDLKGFKKRLWRNKMSRLARLRQVWQDVSAKEGDCIKASKHQDATVWRI